MTNSSVEDYCSHCGAQDIKLLIPTGDNIMRKVCQNCQTVHYENPKVVVGAVTTHQEQFLLCQRAIQPQLGYWTYPAGYLENNESIEEGVCREAFEEAKIDIKLHYLLGLYSLTRINQIHVIYHAELPVCHYGITPESSAVALFSEQDIPWSDLAFPVIKWALKAYIRNRNEGERRLDTQSCGLSFDESWHLEFGE